MIPKVEASSQHSCTYRQTRHALRRAPIINSICNTLSTRRFQVETRHVTQWVLSEDWWQRRRRIKTRQCGWIGGNEGAVGDRQKKTRDQEISGKIHQRRRVEETTLACRAIDFV